jgi:hypothetical protein
MIAAVSTGFANELFAAPSSAAPFATVSTVVSAEFRLCAAARLDHSAKVDQLAEQRRPA